MASNMFTIVDPAELKPADVYRQACLVNSKTSRGRDRGWYQDPFELPFQWHLWFDGGREVCSATFSRQDNQWRPGPVLPLASLTTGEGVADLLGALLTATHFGQRPKALGVILHVADEFAMAEVSGGHATGADGAVDLSILHYNLIDDPCEVLVDHEVSVATTSWRLLPFWGAGPEQERCAAIALSRSREVFLQTLLDLGREWRVPIRVAVTSAPVETLAALPLLQPGLEGGRLVAVTYVKFTAVFAITASGELRSVRSLLHRGSSLLPSGLGDILWNMAISAELTRPGKVGAAPPQVLLISDNPLVLQTATKELEAYSLSRQPIALQTLELSAQAALAAIPGHRPEFLVYESAQVELARSGPSPLVCSQTFPTLWSDWLVKCNFFDTVKLDSVYPTLPDLRLLRVSTLLVYLLGAVLLGAVGHGFYSLMTAMNHPSWNLTAQEVKRTEAAQAKILAERRQIDVTSRLLLPRSKGWSTLEFLLQIFPEDAGVRVDTFTYNVDAARPAASAVKGQVAPSTGCVRTWVLRGVATTQALELLNELNAQRGRAELFQRVAKATGDPSYQPDPTRLITVTHTQGRNPKFDAAAGPAEIGRDPLLAFPFNFEVTVSQTLSDKDPLALPTDKPF
jgi:hypothetical protein